MCLNREELPAVSPAATLAKPHKALCKAKLPIIHYGRLICAQWGPYSRDEYLFSNKNCNWLIRAFATFAATGPTVCPRLFVEEYAPDVEAMIGLVVQLGIQNAVIWLPNPLRRELMWLLGRVSVGVGEFTNPRCMIWGGTGCETLASSIPLLQSFRFDYGVCSLLRISTSPDVSRQG
jgi:hypothetical protein